ncbi:MAG: HYR domain-containing protein, partial [Phycisphaerae bacterium]|nr:HYR domain-containing protein [Phycisphaerae bacterium]
TQDNDPGVCEAVVTWTAPTADDNCAIDTFTSNYSPGDTFPVGTTHVVYTATDIYGNDITCEFDVTVNDTEDPVISGCPSNIEVNADAGTCEAVVTWTAPTADDNCGMQSFTSNYSPGDTFPAGTTHVVYTATDIYGNDVTCEFDVAVLAFNNFVVDVEIQGGIVAGGFTRCITFTFYEACPDPTPLVFEKDVTFANVGGNGLGSATFTDLPCSSSGYTCVTAQDKLHTLLVTVTPTIVSGQYDADFTVANMLLQGDYYDDIADWGVDFIDIVDFGVFITEYGANYNSSAPGDPDGSTPCGEFTVHADADGDGSVDVSDFTFITTNYMLVGDTPCCSTLMAGAAPRSSITVRELRAMGLAHVAAADMNHDGVLDMNDVALFLEGGLPEDETSGVGAVDNESLEADTDETPLERPDRRGVGRRQ